MAEYGYGSIEEMANAIGTSCKVGYRGEDTGVVVLYTKIPSRYRIETAKTERYITDVESGRILAHSKSNGVCLKEDASCRLDDVTLQIERLITKQFPDTASLLPLKNEIVRHDEIKSAKQTSDLLNQLGIGAVLVVVL